jgi:hypothetical protein
MPPVGFELTVPTSERPQTHALDRAATVMDKGYHVNRIKPLFTSAYITEIPASLRGSVSGGLSNDSPTSSLTTPLYIYLTRSYDEKASNPSGYSAFLHKQHS